MIDQHGYRLNVGIIVTNQKGQLFWGNRVRASGWQFPQGGVKPYETLEETMYRELKEETGLTRNDVKILAVTKRWLRYKLPVHLRHRDPCPVCIGQKQKWFLLLLTSSDNKINLKASDQPEFKNWRWVNYWEPLRQVIYFKRSIYSRVLKEFEQIISNINSEFKER
ncbi:MAG: RNA pyrophosphohydrolase [Coxiellaceae bacterium]|jgi:putative (di)nucleoside polyphosphate hydrolase|nr:RNA pyrophosphohydrolase [Coxiellaceae bacterium]